MARQGKHARGAHATGASQRTRETQATQSMRADSNATQAMPVQNGGQQSMSRAEYEAAFHDAFGDPRNAASSQYAGGHHESAPGVTFGATSVLPQQGAGNGAYNAYNATPDYGTQRMATAASPYQRYGEPTANSGAYDKWANQQRADNKFDMNRGKKKKSGCVRVLIGMITVLLIFIIGSGIGIALFLGDIDKIIGLGDQRNDVKMALTDATPGQPYYVLLIGSDSREGASASDAEWAGKAQDGSDAQSDVIILARIDEANHKVTLLTIPRDTPWQQADGQWTKLNNAYTQGGAAELIKAVSKQTGVPISHYAEIHMSGFMELVDTVGGIDVEVPNTIDYHEALTSEEVHIDAGWQHLNGAQAEVFARERTSYGGENQDMRRQGNVREVVKAIFTAIKKEPAWELPSTITACAKCVSTDMTSLELATVLNAIGDPEMLSGTGPYEGDINPNANGLWLCFIDEEGWARVMDVVKSGGDPSTVSYEGDHTYPAGS